MRSSHPRWSPCRQRSTICVSERFESAFLPIFTPPTTMLCLHALTSRLGRARDSDFKEHGGSRKKPKKSDKLARKFYRCPTLHETLANAAVLAWRCPLRLTKGLQAHVTFGVLLCDRDHFDHDRRCRSVTDSRT